MPLIPFPPDPIPTPEELAPFLTQAKSRLGPAYEATDMKLRFARFLWMIDAKAKNPDLFQVAFPPHGLNYPSYLQSLEWQEIRGRVLIAASQKCAGCGKKAFQVHHRDYRPKVLRGEDLSLLVPLCRKCHKFIHTDAAGKHDDTWNDVEDRLIQLVALQDAKEQAAAAQAKLAPPEEDQRAGDIF